MFDFGFSEVLLTSAIALVVLGPEKLPKVARQVGNWVGRARVMARQLTDQLEREVSAEELMREREPTPKEAQGPSASVPISTAPAVTVPTAATPPPPPLAPDAPGVSVPTGLSVPTGVSVPTGQPAGPARPAADGVSSSTTHE